MQTLESLHGVRDITDEIRRQRRAVQRAQTEIRLYRNVPGEIGLQPRGRVNVLDCAKGQFQQRDNLSSPGFITLPARHPMAKWIVTIPNDPEQCKNVVIRTDRYGGAWRWSGLMHHWGTETVNGADYVTAYFNDDLQTLQFTLCPPNPALPIPVFQFPRDFFLFSPSAWGASAVCEMNFVRQQANVWTLPDDPFDPDQYAESLDRSTWQNHIKCPRFGEDSSLWGVFAARMNAADTVIADPMDDAQLSMTYRRIFTAEGETVTGLLDNNVANGACVFEIQDRSGFATGDGTYLTGNAARGFARTVLTWTEDLLEGVLEFVTDDQALTPDEYWQSGHMGTRAKKPGITIRDSYHNPLQSTVNYTVASAAQVIVGGDNPTVDAIADLMISSIGNLLGYFLLVGFDSLGDIASDIVMPFLVGTILAWGQFENGARATKLGWAHLWEVYQSGAEQNVWSLSALATARGGLKDTADETGHQMVIDDSTWLIPGLHCQIGDRIGSTDGVLSRMGVDLMFTNQVKDMTHAFDENGKSEFQMKVGLNKASMSRGERNARMFKHAMDRIADMGVHLVQ